MPLKRVFGEGLNNTVTSDDVLGKEVIDSEGEFLGVVEMLHLDPNLVEVAGITIDKGFLKSGLVIGKDYIERIAPHAIFLKIRPFFKLKGMIVFDSLGEKIGVVSKAVLQENKNQIESLLVNVSSLGREVLIPADLIKSIGENVFLIAEKDNLRFN